MITEALFLLITRIGDFFWALLPNWAILPDLWQANTYWGPLHMGPNDQFYGDNFGNSTSGNPMSAVMTYMYRYNAFFPIYESLLIINYALTVGVASAIYRGIIWCIGIVRGAGTSI